MASRQQSIARAQAQGKSRHQLVEEEDFEPADVSTTRPQRSSSMLMEGIKEELFQLELERQQGQISQADYQKAKAALDQTLERALRREAQKA